MHKKLVGEAELPFSQKHMTKSQVKHNSYLQLLQLWEIRGTNLAIG